MRNAASKELTTSNLRRAAAEQAMASYGLSQRLAARLVAAGPKTLRRDRAADNPEILKKMFDLAARQWRFGYRRLSVLPAREGYDMNYKKLFRLYTEEGLTVRRRKGRKHATGNRSDIPVRHRPGDR